MNNLKKSIFDLKFINTAYTSLPIEENSQNLVHKVNGFIYSNVTPTPLTFPTLISLSKKALSLLSLEKDSLLTISDKPSLSEILSGNYILKDSKPIAHNYSGYQFGSFAGQLGDGRAITLGDVMNDKGEIWEIQLKGSGKTPYSRFADGRAVLRSSIREYLCSEAMFGLGIPTSRALSIVKGEDLVDRDLLYNGNIIQEKCAIVCRLAQSFIRFGSFEIMLETRKNNQINKEEKAIIGKLLDYLLKYHYKFIKEGDYFELFKEIVKRTAELVALWQCYGFCHGVLNTDNMSILGITIDYGPFGFVEYFNKEHICNHSDKSGRYSYKNQPYICKWNLLRLSEALESAIPIEISKNYVEKNYDNIYEDAYYSKMREKLGLYLNFGKDDNLLIDKLFEIMDNAKSDFTNTFRFFSNLNLEIEEFTKEDESLVNKLLEFSPPKELLNSFYASPISEDQLNQLKLIEQNQPYLLGMLGYSSETIKYLEEKLAKITIFENEKSEDRDNRIKNSWNDWLVKYKQRSLKEINYLNNNISLEIKEKIKNRKENMKKVNPKFILRNYILQNCIEKAEKNDFSELERILTIVENPFEENENYNDEYCKKTPLFGTKICVSCSS